MRVSKASTKNFILSHLLPRLEDQDWLLHQSDTLLKYRDELLLGLYLQRSQSDSVLIQVFLRPLYWPAPAQAPGIMEPIGSWFNKADRVGEGWMYLDGAVLAEEEAVKFSRIINARIAPFFAQLNNGEAVLRYQRSHLSDPILSCNPLVSGSRPDNEILGYIAAWSGQQRQARSLLTSALRRRATSHPVQRDHEFESHLETTLRLLDRQEQLQAFLKSTADHIRAQMKLDRARPIGELLVDKGQGQRE